MDTKRSDQEPKEEASKRPYEGPRIEESGDFERLVLACSHLPGPCGQAPPKGTANS